MVWENGETRFQCVENFADFADFARAILPARGAAGCRTPGKGGRGSVRAGREGSGRKAGGKPGSNAWKSPRKWLPMLGKTGETGFQWLEKIRAIFSLDIG